MWFVNVLINAATNYITGNNVLGFLAAVALAAALWAFLWHRRRRKEGKPGVEYTHFIWGGAVAILVGAIALLAGLAWQHYSRPLVRQPPLSAGGEAPTPPVKPRPEYLANIRFAAELDLPLTMTANANSTIDRLRIVIESSPRFFTGTYGSTQPITIAELKDVVRGTPIQVQLVYKAAKPASAGSEYVWGDPSKNFPILPLNRTRLVIIGPDGSEQHCYFSVIQMQTGKGLILSVIPEGEHNWIREWREKDSS